jgi:hypothetical protein
MGKISQRQTAGDYENNPIGGGGQGNSEQQQKRGGAVHKRNLWMSVHP